MGSDDLFKKRKLRREVGRKNLAADRFLIVCEGKETEPNYFRYFKEKIQEKYRDSVVIKIEGEGKNTLSLVDEAIRWKNRAILDYSQVWCVFDKDNFTDDQFNQACQKAKENDIFTAYSVENFELWFVLHFEYQQSALTRDQYTSKMELYLNGYAKNDKHIYHKIVAAGGEEKRAISFARKLDDVGRDLPPSQRNPSTNVFKLVEQLNRFIE